MATQNFSLVLNDNSYLYETNADYSTAHDAATGTVTKASNANIGQLYAAGEYTIYRIALGFDTSGLDDTALIKSAYITGYRSEGESSMEIPVILKDGTPTYPTIPIPVEADYKLANYSGNGGTGTLPIATGVPFTITLNYSGLSWISKTGYSKFLLISQNDNLDEPPTGIEWVNIYTSAPSPPTYTMVLTVEYYVPSEIPVVGDPSYSSIKGTHAIATANVSDDGGGYEERGFQYGLSEAPTWSVAETGVFTGTGDFSLLISGLLPETTYYGRAYVTNDFGTDYSDWISFTTITDTVASYGMYEEDNTATICFYVRKVGGKWSIKHGPYTTDQADIEITKILVEGKGKYQIKFESDVLTGISAGVMVKIDIKARG